MPQNYCRLGGGENQRVLIIGGGDVGVELARRLADGWQVTIMDLDTGPARTALAAEGVLDNISFHDGDATSRLQLEQAGAALADAVALTTRPDAVALEAGKILRRDFTIARLFALLRQAEMSKEFDELSIPYVHDFEAVAGTLIGRVTRGSRVASDVGLGAGEIIETEIMPNSSVIGKPLSVLNPHRWLVAAVYREDTLVVPHGETCFEKGDRVLLVGDPNILPCVARFLSTGHSEFPLPYGTGVGVLAPGRKSNVAHEVEYLLNSTHAGFVEFLEEGPESMDLDEVKRQFSNPSVDLRQTIVESLDEGPLAKQLDDQDLGLLVLPPPTNNWMTRTGLRGSAFLRRLQGLNVPTLVARGTHPYRRIMLVISDPELDSGATVLAIDIARMLDASLTVVVANPPDFVAGPRYAGSIDSALEGAVELARSYGLTAEVIRLTGNPVRQMLEASRMFDLAVAGWAGNTRTTILRPRVEQSLVHQAPCSMLVLPG